MRLIDRQLVKGVELVFLFIFLPLIYLIDEFPIHKIFPLLFLFAYCVILLSVYKQWKIEDFILVANWKLLLTRFAVIASCIIISLLISSQNEVMANFEQRPFLLRMVILYPILSALPQEIIYRKFFLFRYESLLPNRSLLIICNILLFAFAHLYFLNSLVLIATLIGGYIFNQTYNAKKSLLVVSIEHSLYGLILLSSGYTDYFNKPF